MQNIKIEKRLTTLFCNFSKRNKRLDNILKIIWFLYFWLKRYFRLLRYLFFIRYFVFNWFLNFFLICIILFIIPHILLFSCIFRFHQTFNMILNMKWPVQVTRLMLKIRSIQKFNWQTQRHVLLNTDYQDSEYNNHYRNELEYR